MSRLAKHEGMNWGRSVQRNGSVAFSASEAELKEQVQAWKENPSWVDKPPVVEVRIG
jgi:hypothetical protein